MKVARTCWSARRVQEASSGGVQGRAGSVSITATASASLGFAAMARRSVDGPTVSEATRIASANSAVLCAGRTPGARASARLACTQSANDRGLADA
jgi:hypothetical protein